MSLLYPQFPDWCWYVNIAKESNCIALKCRYFNLVHNKEYFSHVLIFVQTSFVYFEEEQTIQWPKEKAQRDKQRSTKHTYKTNNRVTRIPLKT
jgi:hypothetical protein